ncbi:hypothetical protein EM20IM_07065 [Candidatus Methylacidiphilum infernorum]|uniref:Uncharacterized protein n=1 Tax=Candidatus Methylacidiphilum infernorum TaxID=511746 RepID=A0ABX7PUB7_9BACT|nr:hypothetical protein [Candidatus Methylacidiphilum infernorum]QSR86258.1 hypothetical protein EM20IM_07065 [Candidatus Methylacidiphilum infernorum]
MKKNSLRNTGLAIALGSILFSGSMFAQNAPESPDQPSSTATSHHHDRAYRHKMAKQMHEKMQRLMDKQDEELKKLVNEMNKAPKDQKLDKAVELLNTLVNQRIQMHEEMKSMHRHMMNLKEHHE